MSKLWGPITVSSWRATPCVSGRVATEADVKAGTAVFFVQGESQAAQMTLPQCGMQVLEDGSKIPVVVIQAEVAPSGVILGIRPLTGGNGICLAHEVELLPNGFKSRLPPNNKLQRKRGVASGRADG
jgi:hypothetical protein